MEGKKCLPLYATRPLTQDEIEIRDKYCASDFFKNTIRCGPKGYFFHEEYVEHAADIYNMPVLPTDIFVATFPRSGTTCTQELVWLVANNLDFDTALSKTLDERCYDLNIYMLAKKMAKLKNTNEDTRKKLNAMKAPLEVLAEMPSPRFFKIHFPLSLLPPDTLDTAKVVYVARDPRDVMVSCFHYLKNLLPMDQTGDFKSFFDVFVNDLVPFSPYFEHVKEAWAQRDHPNMLFLFYEELSKDLKAVAERVARFLGRQYTDGQLDRLCEHLKFENFQKNKMVDNTRVRQLGLFKEGKNFIRKGKVGGWREYFDEEMTRRAESWMEDNLRDVDLRFPSE